MSDKTYNTTTKLYSNGMIIGEITYVTRQRVMTILSVDVEHHHRKVGWGTNLMKYVIRIAKGLGCKRIELDNMLDGQSTFYKRLGFAYVESQESGPEMFLKI